MIERNSDILEIDFPEREDPNQKRKKNEKELLKKKKKELRKEKKRKKQKEKEKTKNSEETIYGKDAPVKWDKLDNTANLFPVIAGEHMTNVFRMCVCLTEDIKPELLQTALEVLLPWFQNFHSSLKKGFFWYYFEENRKKLPPVIEENTYPCQYFAPNSNQNYLFRVSYYKNRINLEVFHVLTDGSGARNFLRELTYQYLRLAHPELEQYGTTLSSETSLNQEDSFLKNYRNYNLKAYNSPIAYLIKGERFRAHKMGIIHASMNLKKFKEVAHKYDASINEYIVAVFFYSVYKEYMHKMPSKQPVSVGVPVDLRPFFDSDTTKNFFVVISAYFKPEKEDYHFEEIVEIAKKSLRSQITKKQLEEKFSFAVGNEKIMILRTIPLVFKSMGIRAFYKSAARKNSSTITNVGSLKVKPEYEPYITDYFCFLSRSYGQDIKACTSSYKDRLNITFSSVLKDTSIQRCFYRHLAEEGLEISMETNGVYYG